MHGTKSLKCFSFLLIWFNGTLCTQVPALDPRCYVDSKGEYVDKSGMGVGNMDWIDLAQDRGRWRALMKVVINIRVS